MITEIATFQLKADIDLSGPETPAGNHFREVTVPNMKAHGARSVYYGRFLEKPYTFMFFVNWNSIDNHKAYLKSPENPEHLKRLSTFMEEETPITMFHVPFGLYSPSDDPSPALGTDPKVGVTEVVFMYFPSTLSKSEKGTIMSSVDKMRPVMGRSEALGVYDGWSVEDHVPNPGPNASPDKKSQVYVNVVGWADVEAHMRVQRSEEFRENIHHLMGIKEIRHSELFHVKLHAA